MAMNIVKQAAWLGAALALSAGPAAAADLVSAAYDASDDTIVVTVAYQGVTDGHRFSVTWDACDTSGGFPARATGRLTDAQGNEPAERPFQVKARLSLDGLECRPAEVTLRLGRISHQQLLVPTAR
jgi:hypothetical protein